MTLGYRNFIDLLLEEKGLTNLDPNVLEEIRNDLERRLENWINARILEKIPDDKLDEFDKFLDQNPSQEEIFNFVSQYIEDPDIFLAKVLLDFRMLYLAKG